MCKIRVYTVYLLLERGNEFRDITLCNRSVPPLKSGRIAVVVRRHFDVLGERTFSVPRWHVLCGPDFSG